MNTVNELNMHAFYEEMPQTQNYDLFLQEKLRGIYENYQGFHTFSFPKESVENYEEMKKYLLMEVLPLHRCTELPHKKILDFGLVFRLAGRKGNENLLINQDLARMYGKSGEELSCEYGEDQDADVKLKAESSMMRSIIDGKMTFQKGFMSGEITAKGNFKTLRMLDQIFRFRYKK